MIQKPSKQNKTQKSLGYISCNICDKKPVAVVQSLSHVQLFETPWTVAHQASLTFTISQSLLKLLSIELVTPFNHLILCHPLPLLPSVFASIRIFSHKSALHIRWPKYWSFSFSVSLSNEYSGLISFRIDWFDLLEVQETLKSFLQHDILKASVSSMSLSLLYGPTLTSIHYCWKSHSFFHSWKNHGKPTLNHVVNVTSLLFNMLSRFVIAFPPRSKNFFFLYIKVCTTLFFYFF